MRALITLVWCAVLLAAWGQPVAAQECKPAVAQLSSPQGRVELRRAGATAWSSVTQATDLCHGDVVRTGANSRVRISVRAENFATINANSAVAIRSPEAEGSSFLDLCKGALHYLIRSRKPSGVNTPFMNANVEGTEFYVLVDDSGSLVTVLEGKVRANNDAGSLSLVEGEGAQAKALEPFDLPECQVLPRTYRAEAPSKVLIARPRDAVVWALYYPPVIDFASVPPEQLNESLRGSIEQYRQGNLPAAFAQLDQVQGDARDQRFYIYRASLLLFVGRAEEAEADLQQAIARDAKASDAYALQTIVRIVQNKKEEGLKLAQQAVEQDPTSAAAQIALSYAQQSIFKLETALASAEQAAKLDPKNALAFARIAELQLSQGDLNKALEAAKQATDLNPNLARTQSILGFSYLTRIDTKNAKDAFLKSIALDAADPLPHLGLGLAKIREGKLAEGRQDIEQAVNLDPNNSLLRSYVGKAYFEEKRDDLAGRQFEIAKQLDPNDPTPWFYDAIRRQLLNDPVGALLEVESSVSRNANRMVYRSKLLVDQDLAARNVNHAAIHNEVGVAQLGFQKAYEAVNDYPAVSSSHRFLADTYSTLPRHEIARSAELLQSRLLQPTSGVALGLDVADDPSVGTKAGFLRGVSLPASGAGELARLFSRIGTTGEIDLLVGGLSTFGDSVSITSTRDRLAFAVAQMHSETAGSADSIDLEKNVYDVLVQGDVTEATSVQAEFRYSDFQRSQRLFSFDPVVSSTLRLGTQTSNVRLGLHRQSTPGQNFLLSIIGQKSKEAFRDLASGLADRLIRQETIAEVQYIWSSARNLNVVVGGGGYRGRNLVEVSNELNRLRQTNLYAYSHWFPPDSNLEAYVGLSADFLRTNFGSRRSRINPKLGILWRPVPATSLRAAAFRSVRRQIISNETIEPTQVVGFNQFFDDFPGTISKQSGLGLDHKFSSTLSAGGDTTYRQLKVPLQTSLTTSTDFDWKERALRGYLYWLLRKGDSKYHSWNTVLTVDVFVDRLQRPEALTGIEGILDLKTRIVPVTVSLFGGKGMTMRLTSTYVQQRAKQLAFLGLDEFTSKDSFWITDLTFRYRLPTRTGSLVIGLKNLTNQRFRFVETDPSNPRFPSERLAFGRLSLEF